MLVLEGITMGFRFRKSIKLLPGIRINLSKSGISTSVGVPGATVNFSDKGTRTTVGIPGTGLSYSERSSSTRADPGPSEPTAQGASHWLVWVMVALVVGAVLFGLSK
jgi:hypothetical protein